MVSSAADKESNDGRSVSGVADLRAGLPLSVSEAAVIWSVGRSVRP